MECKKNEAKGKENIIIEKENKFGNVNESHTNEKLSIPSTSKEIKIGKINNEEKEKTKQEIDEEEKEKVITSEYSRSILKNFIKKWKNLVHPFSKDDKKIAEKIWKNYFACHTSFTHSRKFVDDLQKATANLKTENVFLNISKLIEYLKRYKETQYVEKKKLQKASEDEGSDSGTMSKEEAKRKRKMDIIEKKMTILAKKINKYEAADVDLDDEVNSSYLILERLKLKFVRLDTFYCKLAKCSTFTGRPTEKKFKYQGSRYPEINKRITAWVNKNRCFPEYMDVLDLVKAVTKGSELPLRRETIRVQAQEIFREVGQILQERRIADDTFNICAYASINEDQEKSLLLNPADTDHDLRQKLKVNEESAKQKFDEVFQHFVDKQAELKDTKDKLLKEAMKEKRAREDSTEGNPEEKRQKKKNDETSDVDKGEGSDEDEDASDEEKDASDEEKDASDEEKDASDEEKDASDEEKVASDEEKDASDEEKDDSDYDKDDSDDEDDKDDGDEASVTNKSDSEESDEKPAKRLKKGPEKDYETEEFSARGENGNECNDCEGEMVIESVESAQGNTEEGIGTTSSATVESDDKDKSEEKEKDATSHKVTPLKTESVVRTGA